MLQGHFQYGEDNGLPAGHESLKCLSSAMPLWVGDTHWENKVRNMFEAQLSGRHKYNQEGSRGVGKGWGGWGEVRWGVRARGGEWLCSTLRYSLLLPDSPDGRKGLINILTIGHMCL